MKALIRKTARYAITILLVIIAVFVIFRAWVFYTESPWTRDAKFTADVVAISPDVTGLITDVRVRDNQRVKQGDVLFTIDRPRFQKALAESDKTLVQILSLICSAPAGGMMKLFHGCAGRNKGKVSHK